MPTIYSLLDPPPQVTVDFSATTSLTQQQFADEADINTIMARYEQTGLWMSSESRLARDEVFGDVTGFEDFADVMAHKAAVDSAFMQLPAALRFRFGNDPAQLVAFLQDPDNIAEAQALGIVSNGFTG